MSGVLQLVTCVVEEPSLGLHALLEPVEHVVERPGEGGDVVVAALGDPPGQVGRVMSLAVSRTARSGATVGRTAAAASTVIRPSDRAATIA